MEALNARLAEGLDLHSQLKVAHWNIQGPHVPSLHPLFETFAVQLAAFNDRVAERAVTLGGKAYGTARHVGQDHRVREAHLVPAGDRGRVVPSCRAGWGRGWTGSPE